MNAIIVSALLGVVMMFASWSVKGENKQKNIALFGVSVEPWTDWRRTGFPVLTVPSNVINGVTAVPRSLFYPQSEIDLNPNCPGQKNPSLQDRVFWDN